MVLEDIPPSLLCGHFFRRPTPFGKALGVFSIWRTPIVRLALLFDSCHSPLEAATAAKTAGLETPHSSHFDLLDIMHCIDCSTGRAWKAQQRHCSLQSLHFAAPAAGTSRAPTNRCQQGICLPRRRINYVSRCVQTKRLHSRNGIWSSFSSCWRMRYCIRAVDQLQPRMTCPSRIDRHNILSEPYRTLGTASYRTFNQDSAPE